MFSDGMFSDGMSSDGMFSDGTFSDGMFCMWIKKAGLTDMRVSFTQQKNLNTQMNFEYIWIMEIISSRIATFSVVKGWCGEYVYFYNDIIIDP